MHFPSELLLSHMGLAEAGMWAAHVNDDGQVVLVIKLGTDTLKWIHRGVPVNLLIGHVQTEQALVRVLGLEVFDCKTDPLIPNLPQVEVWEIEGFDDLLNKNQFAIRRRNIGICEAPPARMMRDSASGSTRASRSARSIGARKRTRRGSLIISNCSRPIVHSTALPS